jgi:hypothetical protein
LSSMTCHAAEEVRGVVHGPHADRADTRPPWQRMARPPVSIRLVDT